jgi:hypothetical protein
MALSRSAEITALLKAWNGSDQTALDRLAAQVYDELRPLIAGIWLRKMGSPAAPPRRR